MDTYTHMYIYIYRERERERETSGRAPLYRGSARRLSFLTPRQSVWDRVGDRVQYVCIYIYIYICIYIYIYIYICGHGTSTTCGRPLKVKSLNPFLARGHLYRVTPSCAHLVESEREKLIVKGN